MPPHERALPVLEDPHVFASHRRDTNEALKAATDRIKDAVVRVAGSINGPSWSVLFTQQGNLLRFTEKKGVSVFGPRLVHFGQYLLHTTVQTQGKDEVIELPGVDPGRFNAVIDDVAVRITAQQIRKRIDYLDTQVAARPEDAGTSSVVTSLKLPPNVLAEWIEKGRGPLVPGYSERLNEYFAEQQGNQTSEDQNTGLPTSGVIMTRSGGIDTPEYSALSDQLQRIERGLVAFERERQLTDLVPVMDSVLPAMQMDVVVKRNAALRKLHLTDLVAYIAPAYHSAYHYIYS